MAQLLWTSFDIKQNNISIITPGEDQIVVCAPIVYLEASVSGNLNGHTTEWAQISGTPSVTLFQTSETQAYYVAGGTPGSDKIFRFYIDRNTQLEQFADVVIRTTPTSLMEFIEHGAIRNVITEPLLLSTPFNIQGDIPMDIIPFNSAGSLVTNQVSVVWDLPLVFNEPDSAFKTTFTNYFVGSILEEWNSGDWLVLDTYGINENRSYLLGSNKRLRLTNVFNKPGSPSYVYNQWMDISSEANNLIKGKEVLALLEHGVVNNNVSVTRIVYTLDIRNYQDTATQLEHGLVNGNTIITRLVFILDPRTFIEDAIQLEHGMVVNNVTITRTSGGVIGG